MSSFFPRWLQWFNRYLEPQFLLVVSGTILSMAVLIGLIAINTSQGGMTRFGSPLGADYSAFYVAGTIVQSHSPQELYQLPLQAHLYHSLLPNAPKDVFLPYGNPPFLTLLFQPLSLLPYTTSYLLWLLISVSLFLGGIVLIGKTTTAIPREIWIVTVLLALSFEPFVMENWLGGQISSIGFFCLALALYCEFHHRPFCGHTHDSPYSKEPTFCKPQSRRETHLQGREKPGRCGVHPKFLASHYDNDYSHPRTNF